MSIPTHLHESVRESLTWPQAERIAYLHRDRWIDYPRALEPEKIIELARKAGLESEAAIPVEFAFMRALENSEKDGSIVLSAGSMFVTAEAMRAWNKILSVAKMASEVESK